MGIIEDGEFSNPVHVTERITKKSKTSRFQLAETKRDVEYSFNKDVPEVDWDHEELTLVNLLNVRKPFSKNIIVKDGANVAAEMDE